MHRMNPLGLPAERFLVAEDNKGKLLGFGQLQQQPNPANVQFLELRTLIVRDDVRCVDLYPQNTVLLIHSTSSHSLAC